jgi:hypothetical protein
MENEKEQEEHPDTGMSVDKFREIIETIKAQPNFRAAADKEHRYYDGKQLDDDVVRLYQSLGRQPYIENNTAPAINQAMSVVFTDERDYLITAETPDEEAEQLAQAINQELHQVESRTYADNACRDAAHEMGVCGFAFVEVSRNKDPFEYPYRVEVAPRNEIYWDMLSVGKGKDLSKARWIARRRWLDWQDVAAQFPDFHEQIKNMAARGSVFDEFELLSAQLSGAGQNSLNVPVQMEAVVGQTGAPSAVAFASQNAIQNAFIGLEQQEWRDATKSRVLLHECWYRVNEDVKVIKYIDGRVEEFDEDDPLHMTEVSLFTQGDSSLISELSITRTKKMRVSYWLNSLRLHDDYSPFPHNEYPYAPFFAISEDATGIKYGLARPMIPMQDAINTLTAKLMQGLGSVRVTRTEGAVRMTDDQVRESAGLTNADFVLDEHFTRDGHIFKLERDYELSSQHLQVLNESRAAIKAVAGVYNSEGQNKLQQSGLAIATLAEQGDKALAIIMDAAGRGRRAVGELLLSLIIEDFKRKENAQIVIKGDAFKESATITINESGIDDEGGEYRRNDLSKARLLLSLSDTPTSSSFKNQQLAAMSEAYKSSPPEYQRAMFPEMLRLMNIPNKDEIMKAARDASAAATPEQVQQQIDSAVSQALQKAQTEAKMRELDLKAMLNDAQIKLVNAQAVEVGVKASYAAMQAGQAVATMPQIAPIADVVMQTAGYQPPNPLGVDPNFPQPSGVVAPAPEVAENTSPVMPPVAPTPESPLQGAEHGVETMRSDA